MHKIRVFLVCLSIILAPVGFQAIHAQDADVPPAAAEAEPPGSDMSLLELFIVGGWAMYPLLFLSISGVGLIIYNFMMIREKPFLRPDLMEQLKPVMGRVEIDEAKRICDEHPSVLTNIIHAGLDRVDDEHLDPEAVKEAMEEASTEELASPFIMINCLSIVATLSPMVGLLGTVSGMIKAFHNIASTGMGQPQQLADNISEALITTATGLIVAIPAMFFYFYFKNRYGKIASHVSKQVGDIFFEFIKGVRRQASEG